MPEIPEIPGEINSKQVRRKFSKLKRKRKLAEKRKKRQGKKWSN